MRCQPHDNLLLELTLSALLRLHLAVLLQNAPPLQNCQDMCTSTEEDPPFRSCAPPSPLLPKPSGSINEDAANQGRSFFFCFGRSTSKYIFLQDFILFSCSLDSARSIFDVYKCGATYRFFFHRSCHVQPFEHTMLHLHFGRNKKISMYEIRRNSFFFSCGLGNGENAVHAMLIPPPSTASSKNHKKTKTRLVYHTQHDRTIRHSLPSLLSPPSPSLSFCVLLFSVSSLRPSSP